MSTADEVTKAILVGLGRIFARAARGAAEAVAKDVKRTARDVERRVDRFQEGLKRIVPDRDEPSDDD